MAYRILLQVLIFLAPFLMYGLYRLLMADAQAEGRKTWPIRTLFGIGAVLTIAFWLFLVLREEKSREICYEPERFVDGVLVPPRQVPCERDLTTLGEPLKEDPGGQASGVGPDRRPGDPPDQPPPDDESR